MGTALQSLQNISQQIIEDINSKTGQTTPPVSIAYNRIVSNALAALILTTQLHNIDQRKECFPQTASEEIGLPLWADISGRQRELGDQAQMQVSGTGINGTLIGTGSTGPLLKADNGLFYDVLIGDTISGGVSSITIRCRNAGAEGTLTIGAKLTLTKTIVGIDPDFFVTVIDIPGTESEPINTWRSAIVQIVAFPPQIGTAAWFYNEAISVPGITRAYPYCDEDYPGRVILYCVADDNTDGIPTPAQLALVEDLFTTAGKDILWANGILPNLEKRIEAFSSLTEIYDVIITEGTPALSATLKVSVEASIDNYFLTRNPYIQGLSLSNSGVVEKSAIFSASQNTIESEVGETGRIADIVLQKQGELVANLYTIPAGKRAVANISYT